MKRILFLISAVLGLCIAAGAYAQDKNVKYKFVDATKLTVVGKLFNDTPQPYHRLDTEKYEGFSETEATLLKYSAGIAIAFRSDSPSIAVLPTYGLIKQIASTASVSSKGFDLYIKDSEGRYGQPGRWIFAESTSGHDGRHDVIKDGLDGTMKEFLLYLPTFSELNELLIGVEKGYVLEKIDNPFRHRIAVFGSSFTHGHSTSRAGMTYPAQLSRMTGLQLLNLGVSGNSKLQQHFAKALGAADVDAIIFDAFSNPTAERIEKTLFQFIETIQESHPEIPLIFQQTIYRETMNFDANRTAGGVTKMATAERMMKEAMEKYNNVYFIVPNASLENHDTSVDGTHPSDLGYYLWAQSIKDPVLEILAKYGIR